MSQAVSDMGIAGHRPTILLYKQSISPTRGCILSSEHVERRLAAILAADVAGSCLLIGIDEEGTLRQLKALRKTLFDPKIIDNHGRIVKNTGDGALVEFASVVDAVRCAVEVQRGVADGARAEVPRWLSLRRGDWAAVTAGGLRAADTGLGARSAHDQGQGDGSRSRPLPQGRREAGPAADRTGPLRG